jgi:hypothetical protein
MIGGGGGDLITKRIVKNSFFYNCRENVSDYGKNVIDLKERVFEIIEELLLELETASEEIRHGKKDIYRNITVIQRIRQIFRTVLRIWIRNPVLF